MTAEDPQDSQDGREEYNERHREDLGGLEVSALTTGRPHSHEPRPPWLRWAQIASVVVVVAIVLWALAVPHPTSGPSTTHITNATSTPTPGPIVVSEPAPGVTNVRFAGLPFTCPVAAAWSPDGRRFAILGFASCAMDSAGNLDEIGGTVAIFDAATPNAPPRAVFDLANQLMSLGLPPDEAQVAPEYAVIGWAPDGHTLAVTFNLGADYGDVLLLPADSAGGQARALFAPLRSVATTPPETTPSDAQYFPPAWNLTTGKPARPALPLASAYGWQGDSLVATHPLDSTPPGSGTSLWRSGELALGSVQASSDGASDANGNTPPSALILSLSTGGPLWSPDGTILLPYGIGTLAKLDVPVPTALGNPYGGSTFVGLPADTPTIPVRGAVLRAAIASLTHANALLLWRPDGQRLVLIQPSASVGGALYGYTLDVYDCASGAHLAHLAEPTDRTFAPDTRFAAWSPDGQHLLLLSDQEHTITLFSSAVLGG